MDIAKLLDILSLIISFSGGLAIARGLFISDDDALELGVSRFTGTKEENMKLPAVQDRIKQRKWGIIGAALFSIGLILQLISKFI